RGAIYHTDRKDLEESSAELDEAIEAYDRTISDDVDREQFKTFTDLRKAYGMHQAQTLANLDDGKFDAARATFEGALVERWGEGREKLNDLIEINRELSEASIAEII